MKKWNSAEMIGSQVLTGLIALLPENGKEKQPWRKSRSEINVNGQKNNIFSLRPGG